MAVCLRLQDTERANACRARSPSLPAMASLRISAGAPSLEGRVALVTGAGRGIGRGIAVGARGRRRPRHGGLAHRVRSGSRCRPRSVARTASPRSPTRPAAGAPSRRRAPGSEPSRSSSITPVTPAPPDGPAWEVEPGELAPQARRQPRRAVLSDAPRPARDARRGHGPHRQHRVDRGPRGGRRHDDVRRLEARPRRPHPRGRDRRGQGRRDVQRGLPWLGATGLTEDTEEVWAERAATYPQGASSRSTRSPRWLPTSRATRRPASAARPSA